MATRRSRRRKRERQRRKHECQKEQKRLALQLRPQRTVKTAKLFELIEAMAHVCRDAIVELEKS